MVLHNTYFILYYVHAVLQRDKEIFSANMIG